MCGPSINLELYWQGSYTYEKNWSILGIDINIMKSAHEIFANIDSTLPATKEQRLIFGVSKKEDSFCEKDRYMTIKCSIDLLKSMGISARIFQTYVNHSKRIQYFDGSYGYETYTRGDDLQVVIDEFSNFEPNKTYQMRIVNQGNTLRAIITKKLHDVAVPKLSEKKGHPYNTRTSTKGLNQLSTTFEGLNGIETSELQNRLEQARQKLIAARQSFDKACLSGDVVHIKAELEAEQQIKQEVSSLQRALESRGIPQQDLSSQECVIS